MIWIFPALIVMIVLYGPYIWASSTLAEFRDEEYFSGDGFDFARLLLKELSMDDVRIETSLAGDHYDPVQNVVRLTSRNCGKRSLTAIVVAAHEVGHAIQKKDGYEPLFLRTRLAIIGFYAEKAGAALIMATPLIVFLLRVPVAGMVSALGGLLALGFPVIFHIITLPVEIDASFRKALPILSSGRWIPIEDVPKARKILLACSMTYIASALSGILNFWRWIRLLR